MIKKSGPKIHNSKSKTLINDNSFINGNSILISCNSNKINTLSNYLNNKINKKKNKSINKILINLYQRPFKYINKKEIKERNNPIQKSKTIDFSLMNVSNELYNNSIYNGRKAINYKNFKQNNKDLNNGRKQVKNIKKNINKTVDYKSKEKTPVKKKIKYNKSQINIIKIRDNIKKEKEIQNLNNLKVDNNRHNSKNNINDNSNFYVIGSINRNKISINNITQRLFLKETISSKNKIKANIFYTPKIKLNNQRNKKIIRLRAKTCQMNSKKNIKSLLTSQNSESRFYTIKSLSLKEINRKKKFKKRESFNDRINYAFENIQTYNTIINMPSFQNEKNSDGKENNNTINRIIVKNNIEDLKNNLNIKYYDKKNINYLKNPTKEKRKSKGGLISKLIQSNKQYENNKVIHDILYHTINSLLSLEIVISESKGIVYTKCPMEHTKKYKFSEFFEKFRAIPDFNVSLMCFICKKRNNLNSFFCGKCYNFLCYNCQLNHEIDFGHQPISIQSINTYCSFHNKKYILFCYDCNKNCCESCHSIENKNHKTKLFKDIFIDFKKEEKSINYIKNEINNQLKLLNEFKSRYKEDLKSMDNKDMINEFFEEYISYFKNLLKLKEKLISKYNYNSNNYYNIMNVLNLSLPIFYNYKTENLFKLSNSNELYNKYLIINKFISFINNNSIKIFENHQNFFKFNTNLNKSKIYRTIKPSKILDINHSYNKKSDIYNNFNDDKYPKQIIDFKYNGYFILLKDKSFDVYDKDLNLIKNFNMTKKFGDLYNEVIIGAKLLENKNLVLFNYKKILIIKLSYDFLSYEEINEYDLKIDIKGFNNGFNNFGFDDGYEDKTFSSFINKIIDINKNEILSFGIRFGEKYIGSIWNKNKKYENQMIEIDSDMKYSFYPIYSVLKYNENKFAILESNGNHYNIKIYEYKSPFKYEENLEKKEYKENGRKLSDEINNRKLKKNINEKYLIDNILDNSKMKLKNFLIKEIEGGKENIEMNGNIHIIKNEYYNKNYSINNQILNDFNKGKRGNYIAININKNINKDNLIKSENTMKNFKVNESDANLSEDSEENIDKLLEEIKINTEKKEEEYLKAELEKKIKKEKQDKILILKPFKEIFNLEYIQFRTDQSSSEEIKQQIVLIEINEKLFGFLDKENIIIISFETCQVVTKINYGANKLIYIDKTPNNNLLFKENNTIISYHFEKNDLTRINLPVFEFKKNEKNISSWFLISGSIEFINLAKIINDKFMISLFELRMEKWNINTNLK